MACLPLCSSGYLQVCRNSAVHGARDSYFRLYMYSNRVLPLFAVEQIPLTFPADYSDHEISRVSTMFNNQPPNLGGTSRPLSRPPRNAQIPPRGRMGMGLNFSRNRATDGRLSDSLNVEPASSCKSANVQFGMLDGNPAQEAKLDNISQQLSNCVAMINELSSQFTGVKAVLQALIENMTVWTSDIEGLVREQQAQPQREEPQNPDWFLAP
ncbi:hypothetical protein QBC46DRAFT_428924 [Diplogelasinospora grovesii]|uniref:Uncharacterized protein n=1 Tax=Diplogelasinospora grovesii TaxID=303347 RepID=A0AAN6MXP5_9PEZI|nr:hypothetical protein QBC46DRAFT_428924 [Diplogelasinospora grovesii]